MVRLTLFLLAALLALPATAAAAPWSRIADELGARADLRPDAFRAYDLDRSELRGRLANAPMEGSGAPGVVVSIPGPRGVERFRVVESPVMQPGLAELHPDIKTYAGRGIDDPTAAIRFDLTPVGFHASVRSAVGSWYVDPPTRGDRTTHVAYWGHDLENGRGIAERFPPIVPDGYEPRAPRRTAEPGAEVPLRTYRLALVSDPEYAAYHGDENVTAAKVTLMNRVNQIYNDDLAIRLVLVEGNDALNFHSSDVPPNGGYHTPGLQCLGLPCFPGADGTEPGGGTGTGEACDIQTISYNNAAIDIAIGEENYDIGHIALGEPGGGVAYLGVVGDPTLKAGGCTGLETPTGDFFAVDYVAHEMGHQFGGDHTFNGTEGSCGANGGEPAVEPGSGTTVMAYAGICASDDLQPHSDPYFSFFSQDQVEAHVADDEDDATTNEGFTVTPSGNHAPLVTAPAAVTIPVRTPFTLTGSGSDVDGDPLTYLWEQTDAGSGTALTDNEKADGPLFRVFGRSADVSEENALLYSSPGENAATSADSTRTFPDPAQIAAGNTNAATGTCPPAAEVPEEQDGFQPLPIRECYGEFLPTSPRVLNFRLTARDLFPNGGGVSHAATVVTVAGEAPFRVTSQAAPAAVAPGSALPVTWDVAGTNADPFNVANVRITYSTDGGATFPTVLAASTPNDGAETVTIPTTPTTGGRIRVEAIDNVFFDVTRGDITVAAPATAATTGTTTTASTGTLRPSLSRVSRRLRASRTRRVKLRLRCASTGTFTTTTPCRGTVRILGRYRNSTKRLVAKRRFSFPRTQTRTLTVRIARSAYRRTRGRGLPVRVTMSVVNPGKATRTASKRVRLVRRTR